MRILFVAIPSNIHTLRWVSQLTDLGWEIHMMPSMDEPLHPDLVGKVIFHGPEMPTPIDPIDTTAIDFTLVDKGQTQPKISFRELAVWLLLRWPHHRGSGYAHRLAEKLKPGVTLPPVPPPPPPLPSPPPPPQTRAEKLAEVIRQIRPDIIHSLLIQHSGYTTLAARKLIGDEFPVWIASNWGTDVHFYGRLKQHKEHIQEVLSTCDYLACDCERDISVSQQFGFTGRVLPVLSAAGGFDLERWQKLRQPGPTSSRRIILLKGYQHTVGRALVGLRALELCADVLQGYRIVIQSAFPDVIAVAEYLEDKIGIPIESVPHAFHKSYEEIMSRYGQARIYIALSISDGLSQAWLESVVMGAFPIQSGTSCVDEWIEDGVGGFIVPPEDPHTVAAAIRRAIVDDELVDRAAEINAEMVRKRLAYDVVKEKAVAIYKSVYEATQTTPF